MSSVPPLFETPRPYPWMIESAYLPPPPPFAFLPCELYSPQYAGVLAKLRELQHTPRPMEQISRAMNKLGLNEVDAKICSDADKFQVKVDVRHFAPDEVSVMVADGHVIVEGKHKERRDQHGYVSRQFVRKYALPQGCLPDTVQSALSSDGILTVTAPKVLAMPSIGERIVPITPTGPIKKQFSHPPGVASPGENILPN